MVPTLQPTPSPSPVPTPMPTPVPSQLPLPLPTFVPTPGPSPLPTTHDMVMLDVTLVLSVAATEDITEATVENALLATIPGLDPGMFVTAKAPGRRLSRIADTASGLERELPPEGRRLPTTLLTVTAELRASLARLGYSTADAFEEAVSGSLGQAAADGSLAGALQDECLCFATVTSSSVVQRRDYPTLHPTVSFLPTPAPSTTSSPSMSPTLQPTRSAF